jgi:cytochrome c55X
MQAAMTACICWLLVSAARAGEVDPARGWAALRAMDCARCHGREYGGWSAPSLLAAVRDGPRERFDRYVLEGDPMRGMPGYRSHPLILAELDAIYAYLRARSEGRVVEGLPVLGAMGR